MANGLPNLFCSLALSFTFVVVAAAAGDGPLAAP
jgi:hypothetical protein